MNPTQLDRAMGLIEEIQLLKKEKNAVILGHNYMTPDVYHGVSDFTGDSLALARLAAETDAEIIIFNGVYFMAETAKVLNPEKMVLSPDYRAGCSLVDAITAEDVRAMKEKYPGVPVVTYVNSSAEVKAETDICCTSANALKVVESLPGDRVIFLPDEYLASNVALQSTKEIIPWKGGRCMVHEEFTVKEIEDVRKHYGDLLVVAHPECSTEITALADYAGSTSQMETFIRESDKKNIMLVTECSMSDNLRSQFPDRNFIASCHICPYMKMITLEKVLESLQKEQFRVEVPEDVRIRAKRSVDRMLEVGR